METLFIAMWKLKYEGEEILSIHKTLSGANAAAKEAYEKHNKDGYCSGTGTKSTKKGKFVGEVSDSTYYVQERLLKD
jgi:hypothetical protein